MEQISNELKQYIEEKILPEYDTNNIGGHGIEHIKKVIQRSFDIIEEFKLNVNKDMVYTIAAFHDIGYKENPEKHEEVSSEKFKSDKNLLKFFNDEQINIIAEAIVDHRASLEYEARSIYGKIVSSADRETSVENILKRSFLYQAGKFDEGNLPVLDVIENSYRKLSSKYGKGGYAKMYYQDKQYLDFLQGIQELIENKPKFIESQMEIARKLGKI